MKISSGLTRRILGLMHGTVAIFLLTTLVFFAFTAIAFAADGAKAGIPNPLKFGTVPEFIAAALQAMVMISLPILTIFIVYSGFLFVSARGNSSQLEKAKSNFLYVIIGSILILGAWVIATLIGGTVTQLIEPTVWLDIPNEGLIASI